MTTNAFVHLGLGCFIAVSAAGFIVSQAGLPISVVSQAILWMSCGAAAFTALVLIRGGAAQPHRLACPSVPGSYGLTLFACVSSQDI